MTADLSLERLSAKLGWPCSNEIFSPPGAGPAVYAGLVQDKIGRILRRMPAGEFARLGILTADAKSATTEPPLAIVAEFPVSAPDDTLRELHRLAWNFSHAPTLITIEPHLLRVWSCCEPPVDQELVSSALVQTVEAATLDAPNPLELAAARAIHWMNLVSGEFFAKNAGRFDRDGRADQMLLSNLRDIRQRLISAGLDDDDICHDLLARVIFVQFLFDRKDADGAAALNSSKLASLYSEGVLSAEHSSFASILQNYDDTYRLFDWLNIKFNGDLFPGKGDDAAARAAGWRNERAQVTPVHLELLADFVGGRLDMPSGQTMLWPQYAFDVIPLEFISSIYETFVSQRAAQEAIFYTPPHMVDFILDRVLPWDGETWDLRILDPACGSGIFLVKSFQRLVHRWRRANPGQQVKAAVLRRMLEKNLCGVDKDPHAVRVACFSLYLAMCDEIEPRHYWSQVVFPTMRGRRLICSDFFEYHADGYYDLILGNAPWGDGLVTAAAHEWAADPITPWTVANKDIGGLFLAKAQRLLAPHARIAMIQSANALLFNNSPTAKRFRQEVFSRLRVRAIYNLSALRFQVFKRKSHTLTRSVSPACVFIIEPGAPLPDDRIEYVSPKAMRSLVDEFSVVIEPQDRRSVTAEDAARDELVWTVLMWGGARDRALIRRLLGFPTIASLHDEGLRSSRGVQFGNRKKVLDGFSRHRLFDDVEFPKNSFPFIDARKLPYVEKLEMHSRDALDREAFQYPQLIVKRSWRKSTSRFEARVAETVQAEPILCNQSYVSVHGSEPILEAALMSFSSKVATYFLQLVSGRLAAYRPEALVSEIRQLPIAWPRGLSLKKHITLNGLDTEVFDAFGFQDAERVLVDDMVDYTIPDFRGNGAEPGRQRTASAKSPDPEQILLDYCSYFERVIRAGFGHDRSIHATIFAPTDNERPLPYRLVAFELSEENTSRIEVKSLTLTSLMEQMEQLDRNDGGSRRGLYGRMTTRVYDASSGRPTIFVMKPDMVRYWTRSVALEDGDEVSADLFRWLLPETVMGTA